MNSNGEFADKDGVLLTMTTEPTTIKMEDLELPDIKFTGRKYIAGNKEDLVSIIKAPEATIVAQQPTKLNPELAIVDKGEIHALGEKEEEKEEEDTWVDMEVSEDEQDILFDLLGKYFEEETEKQ